MRIQETDRILKESRTSRHANARHEHGGSWLSRAWQSVASLLRLK
jgi:hypothetical protein